MATNRALTSEEIEYLTKAGTLDEFAARFEIIKSGIPQTWKDVLNSENKRSGEYTHGYVYWDENKRKFKDVGYIPQAEQQQIKQKLMPEFDAFKFGPKACLGKEYEFYDTDGRFPENLIFVGKCADLHLGCYKDVYEDLLKKYPIYITGWRGIREAKKKEPIQITIEEVKKKFGYADDQPVYINVSDTWEANKSSKSEQESVKKDVYHETIDKYLSEYDSYKLKPAGVKMNFKLDDDGFTDKTDIFDNKQMD